MSAGQSSGGYLTLWQFFSEGFVPLGNLSLPLKPAHKVICDTIEDSLLGFLGKQFVIINIPPRIGKTKIMEAAVCWLEGLFPDSQFLLTSYSSDNAEASLAYIKKVMREDWYRSIFGERVGAIAKADKLVTTHGGQIFAAGLEGSLLGKGGGLKRPAGGGIIVDDPSKATEAKRETGACSVASYFETDIKDRRNSDQYCPIIIIAQRLAIDDLCGYVMATYPNDYHLIEIPAFDEATQTSNFPETYSAENLIASRDSTVSNIRFAYWSKMQQKPIAQGGNLIPIDKFLRWDPADAWHPELNPGGMKFERRVFTVDTALKTKEHNDFSCVQLWGKLAGKTYLIDQIHGKWESPQLLTLGKDFWVKWMKKDPRGRVPLPPTRVLIESKAAGTGLAQQMRSMGIPAEEVERNTDKASRVENILNHIECRLVVVPEDNSTPWIAGFLLECAAFSKDGTAKHDDQVDAMADGVSELCGAAPSIFDVLGVPPNRR